MPLNHILRIHTGGYKLKKLLEKFNNLIDKDHHKLFAKNEKELEIQAERILSEDVRMKVGIKMCHSNDENWKTTNDERNRDT